MQTSEAETLLIKALHRAQFERLAEFFGDKYSDPEGEDLERLKTDWVPLLRAFVHYEHRLCMEREAALRAAIVDQTSTGTA